MRLIAIYVLASSLFGADVAPFAYDKNPPLDPHEHEIATRNGTRIALVNFAVTSTVQSQAFFDAASEPKVLKWYDTAHDVLDISAISDGARFLASHLRLKRIDPILKAKIGVR